MFWQVGPTFVGGPDWKMTKKHIKISPKFNNKILPMLKGSSIKYIEFILNILYKNGYFKKFKIDNMSFYINDKDTIHTSKKVNFK